MNAHEDLLARRVDYPALARGVYLANHTLGAMHRRTPERLAAYTQEWATRGVEAWESWQPEVSRVADILAALIGAPTGSVVLRTNVADLVGAVASAFDLRGRRNRVIYPDDIEWPGSHYLWSEQARLGADVVTVPVSRDGGTTVDLGHLVDALDARTAIVCLSHVLFRTGTLLDPRPVVDRAHEVGALVLLDAYQSAGIVPVDVTELGVDLCVGGSVKYLCGGPGVGWLYVRPGLADWLRPTQVGWFAHERPFDFEFAPIRLAPGPARFAGGTPNVPAIYAAEPGYTAIAEVGVDRIRERSVWLTQPVVEAALERGWRVSSPMDPDRRGGHVAVDPGDAGRVCAALSRRGFTVDQRPGVGLRIAPHFFSTAEECAAVVTAIDEVLHDPAA